MNIEEAVRLSSNLRETGNDFFRSGLYPLAWKYYNESLKVFDKIEENEENVNDIIPLKIKIHSNLSAVELKLHNYIQAEYHCSHVLKKYDGHPGISAQRLKLYFRRYKCLFFLERFEEALRDVKFCVMHRKSSNERLFLNERAKLKKFSNERNFLRHFGSREKNDHEEMKKYYVENMRKQVKLKKTSNLRQTFDRMYMEGVNISEKNQRIKSEFEIKFGYDEMSEGENQLYKFKLFNVALHKFENALVSFRNNNHPEGLGTCYYNLGNVFAILHQRNKAIKYYLLALEIAKKQQDIYVLEGLSRQLAGLLIQMPPPPRASHNNSATSSSEEEEEEGEGEEEKRFCYVFKDCYSYLKNCMRIKTHIEDPVGMARVHESLSELLLREKKFEKAIDNINKARKIYNAMKEEEVRREAREAEKEKKREKEESERIRDAKQGLSSEQQVFQELKKFRQREKEREAEEEAREAKRLSHQKMGGTEKIKYLSQRLNQIHNLETRILFEMNKYEDVSTRAISEDNEEENMRDLYKIFALTALSLKSWDRTFHYLERGIKICKQIKSSLEFHKCYFFKNKVWHNDFEMAHFLQLKAKCIILKHQLNEKKWINPKKLLFSKEEEEKTKEEEEEQSKKQKKQKIKRKKKVNEVRALLDQSTSLYIKCMIGYTEWNTTEFQSRFEECINESFQEYLDHNSSLSSSSSNGNDQELKKIIMMIDWKPMEFRRKRAKSEVNALMSVLEEFRALVDPKQRKEKFEVFLECVSQVSHLLYPDSFE